MIETPLHMLYYAHVLLENQNMQYYVFLDNAAKGRLLGQVGGNKMVNLMCTTDEKQKSS